MEIDRVNYFYWSRLKVKLDLGSIRSSLKDGLSTPSTPRTQNIVRLLTWEAFIWSFLQFVFPQKKVQKVRKFQMHHYQNASNQGRQIQCREDQIYVSYKDMTIIEQSGRHCSLQSIYKYLLLKPFLWIDTFDHGLVISFYRKSCIIYVH